MSICQSVSKLTHHWTTLAWNHVISRIMSGNSPKHNIPTTCVCLNMFSVDLQWIPYVSHIIHLADNIKWFLTVIWYECRCRKLLSIHYCMVFEFICDMLLRILESDVREGRLFELEIKTNKGIDPWITNNTSVQLCLYFHADYVFVRQTS